VLPAAVLRSAGLEIVGMGTGTAAAPAEAAAAIRELYELLRTGAIRVDIERIPLDRVAEVWHRDQGGRRPVLIP
jgi:NADPH2:quinone reductase